MITITHHYFKNSIELQIIIITSFDYPRSAFDPYPRVGGGGLRAKYLLPFSFDMQHKHVLNSVKSL